jgi:nucleoside 2-deoxyribosyltransferase
MIIKIYLAAQYGRREELNRYRVELHNRGFVVTSRWLNDGHHMPDHSPSDYKNLENQRFALEDWKDLAAADIVVSFTEPSRSGPARGGRHVEFGAALAMEKTCFVVGYRENVFHYLPQVQFFPTWEGVVDAIAELYPAFGFA